MLINKEACPPLASAAVYMKLENNSSIVLDGIIKLSEI